MSNLEQKSEQPLPLRENQVKSLEEINTLVDEAKAELAEDGSQKKPLEELCKKFTATLADFAKQFNLEETGGKGDSTRSVSVLRQTYEKLTSELRGFTEALGLRVFLKAIEDQKVIPIEAKVLQDSYGVSETIYKITSTKETITYFELKNLLCLDAFEYAKYSRLPQALLEQTMDFYCDNILASDLSEIDGQKRFDQFVYLIEENFGYAYLQQFYAKVENFTKENRAGIEKLHKKLDVLGSVYEELYSEYVQQNKTHEIKAETVVNTYNALYTQYYAKSKPEDNILSKGDIENVIVSMQKLQEIAKKDQNKAEEKLYAISGAMQNMSSFNEVLLPENLDKRKANIDKILQDTQQNVLHFDQEKGTVKVWKVKDGKKILLDTMPAKGGVPIESLSEDKKAQLEKEKYSPTPHGQYWIFNRTEHVSARYPNTWIPYGAAIKFLDRNGKELTEKSAILQPIIRNISAIERLKTEIGSLPDGKEKDEKTATLTDLLEQETTLIQSGEVRIKYQYPFDKRWYDAVSENATFFDLEKKAFKPLAKEKDPHAVRFLQRTLDQHSMASVNPEDIKAIFTLSEFIKEDGSLIKVWDKHDFGPRVVRMISPEGIVEDEFFHSEAGRDYDLKPLEYSHGCVHLFLSDVYKIEKYTQDGSVIIITDTKKEADARWKSIMENKVAFDINVAAHLQKKSRKPTSKKG